MPRKMTHFFFFPAAMGCIASSVALPEDPTVPDGQCHSLWNGSVCGVYNKVTEQIEWKQLWKHGTAGVWNPTTKAIEWKQVMNNGVAGVWNPVSKRVGRRTQMEWR